MSPYSMGSSSLQELYSYMEDFKRGELNMSDCEKLYRAWQDRNRDHTPSIKEKKVVWPQLANMENFSWIIIIILTFVSLRVYGVWKEKYLGY